MDAAFWASLKKGYHLAFSNISASGVIKFLLKELVDKVS
jgi:hypothetical protein